MSYQFCLVQIYMKEWVMFTDVHHTPVDEERFSCMSFSVFNSSQPVTMETVSWGELKTKNAVQIQVTFFFVQQRPSENHREQNIFGESGPVFSPIVFDDCDSNIC